MGQLHQLKCCCIVLFILSCTVLILPTTTAQTSEAFSTKIQLGIGHHVDIRCSDFSPTHRDGDLFWVKASSQLNPIRRGKCTDCVAFTITSENDKVSLIKQQDSYDVPDFLPNINKQLSRKSNHHRGGVLPSSSQNQSPEVGDSNERVISPNSKRLGNSSTLHLTVYQDDDFGTYYCKQRTGAGLRDNINLLAIQILPQDESKSNSISEISETNYIKKTQKLTRFQNPTHTISRKPW